MPWDPAQYLKFADHRLRPAVDLLARIDSEQPRRVYDLGAGAGNVTRLLKERWPEAAVTGVENSAPMLERARAAHPEIQWEEADLGRWRAAEPAASKVREDPAVPRAMKPRTIIAIPSNTNHIQLPRRAFNP